MYSLLALCAWLSLLWRLNIHIDLLSSSAAKQAAPVDKHQDEYDDYENRYNRDHTRTTPTSTFTLVSHDAAPYVFRVVSGGVPEGDSPNC